MTAPVGSRQQAVDPQVCSSVEGVAKSSWRTLTWSRHFTPLLMRTLYLLRWWDMMGLGMQWRGAWGGQMSMHSLAYSPAKVELFKTKTVSGVF